MKTKLALTNDETICGTYFYFSGAQMSTDNDRDLVYYSKVSTYCLVWSVLLCGVQRGICRIVLPHCCVMSIELISDLLLCVYASAQIVTGSN